MEEYKWTESWLGVQRRTNKNQREKKEKDPEGFAMGHKKVRHN
jgi:hypothetical protein